MTDSGGTTESKKFTVEPDRHFLAYSMTLENGHGTVTSNPLTPISFFNASISCA